MSKNIVILLDGTSNEISEKRTNILRLYGCLVKSPEQLVYYDPGVGTMNAGAWSKTLRRGSEVWGLATGFGINRNVKEAYRFLVENYDDGRNHDKGRDRIFIFGFSRGAYTARMLAGFIHHLGLIERRNLNLVDYAFRAYKRIGAKSDRRMAQKQRKRGLEEVRLYNKILRNDKPPIRLLGLFDTVASVIEPGPGLLPRLRVHDAVSENPAVECIRHAVALDERRRMFRSELWPEGQTYHAEAPREPSDDKPATEGAPQDAIETWFNGVHGDIGGGVSEDESGLAKIALNWMIEQTDHTEIQYNKDVVRMLVLAEPPDGEGYTAPDAKALRHESMTLPWKIIEYLPLPTRVEGGTRWKWTRGEPRKVPDGARIHASVVACAGGDANLPPLIPGAHQIDGTVEDWKD